MLSCVTLLFEMFLVVRKDLDLEPPSPPPPRLASSPHPPAPHPTHALQAKTKSPNKILHPMFSVCFKNVFSCVVLCYSGSRNQTALVVRTLCAPSGLAGISARPAPPGVALL